MQRSVNNVVNIANVQTIRKENSKALLREMYCDFLRAFLSSLHFVGMCTVRLLWRSVSEHLDLMSNFWVWNVAAGRGAFYARVNTNARRFVTFLIETEAFLRWLLCSLRSLNANQFFYYCKVLQDLTLWTRENKTILRNLRACYYATLMYFPLVCFTASRKENNDNRNSKKTQKTSYLTTLPRNKK